MRALLAALETLPLMKQFIELLSPLRIQGDHNIPVIVEPFPALHSELLLFHRVFNCLV